MLDSLVDWLKFVRNKVPKIFGAMFSVFFFVVILLWAWSVNVNYKKYIKTTL